MPTTANTIFLPTRWSLILAAGATSTTRSRRALEELARIYWYPLYAYIRRRGHSPQTAEDLTQEFFATLLEKNLLAATSTKTPLDPAKGRFRAFLLACLKNFLANEHDKSRTQKRGGHVHTLSLDTASAESRYLHEPADALTPDRLYERRWALALLDSVLAQLAADYATRSQSPLFQALLPTLTSRAEGTAKTSYAAIATSLNMTEPALKTAAHRLRRRYRDLLRTHISHTVASPEEIPDEIAYLFNCL